MLTLREFIRRLDGKPERAPDLEGGDVVTARVLGFDIVAVLLPSEVLSEDRVSRMNGFWDLIAHRDALVMRSDLVVVLAPLLDDDMCFLQAVEDFTVQQLVA